MAINPRSCDGDNVQRREWVWLLGRQPDLKGDIKRVNGAWRGGRKGEGGSGERYKERRGRRKGEEGRRQEMEAGGRGAG